jgi:SET domain
LITSRGTRDQCVTIQRMLDEYDKGTESEFYPYIRYLFDGHKGGTRPGLLPTAWSSEAQSLLKSVTGEDLLPEDIEHGTAIEHCHLDESIDGDDPDRKQRRQDAYLFWISRSWTDKMVPILDMINHRNGKWLNVESTSAHVGRDIVVYAIKPIKKGEQLYNSYNECLDRDCDGIKYTYVTPHILADYGFVDAYPKRWMFEIPVGETGEDKYDVFVVDVDEDETSGKVVLKWNFKKPTEVSHFAWIEKQLDRLKGMEDDIKKNAASLSSDHEKYTILDLFNGYKEVFELALIHRDDKVHGLDDEEDGDDDDDDDEEGEEL